MKIKDDLAPQTEVKVEEPYGSPDPSPDAGDDEAILLLSSRFWGEPFERLHLISAMIYLGHGHFGQSFLAKTSPWPISIGPLPFGPASFWPCTLWPMTLWPLSFGPKSHFGYSPFGQA